MESDLFESPARGSRPPPEGSVVSQVAKQHRGSVHCE